MFQRSFAAAQHDIVDLVIAQIAQRGGVALPAGEEVFVNAQNTRTTGRVPLPELAAESVAEMALHRGCSDAFSAAQPAAVDAVQMLLEDHLAEGFAGSLARQDPRQRLAETAPALPALPLAGFQPQPAVA